MSSSLGPSLVLADLFARAKRIVAFTGAGLSTECGVPDFRSPGSPWLEHKPIDFRLFMTSAQVRAEAWRRKFAIDDISAHAQPGRGHRALKRLVDNGKVGAVITQNIDGLHQASGISNERIIELHGNGTWAHCLTCAQRYELADVRQHLRETGEAPTCACGGYVKSATISFGQAMPEDAMRRASVESQTCDLFIAIGSSLVVRPAAAFPKIAREAGAKLVILNRERTPLDDPADVVLHGDIGDILEPAVGIVDSA